MFYSRIGVLVHQWIEGLDNIALSVYTCAITECGCSTNALCQRYQIHYNDALGVGLVLFSVHSLNSNELISIQDVES
jgi:hypothetical protein